MLKIWLKSIFLFSLTVLLGICNFVKADSPKGVWGGVTPIADNAHPNLFYNQSEIDELRNQILVQKNPSDLYDLYVSSIRDSLAGYSTPPEPASEDAKNFKAALSYMMEPTLTKANAIKANLLSQMSALPDGIGYWDRDGFADYPDAWQF